MSNFLITLLKFKVYLQHFKFILMLKKKNVFFLKKTQAFFFKKKPRPVFKNPLNFNFKKKKSNLKIKSSVFLSCFNLFFNGSSIFLKKIYLALIKFNSFKKQKRIIQVFFTVFKYFFKSLSVLGVQTSFNLKFKGKIAAKGSAKKKKTSLALGSFYCNLGKRFYVDQKPSSSKQGCVNIKFALKIN